MGEQVVRVIEARRIAYRHNPIIRANSQPLPRVLENHLDTFDKNLRTIGDSPLHKPRVEQQETNTRRPRNTTCNQPRPPPR